MRTGKERCIGHGGKCLNPSTWEETEAGGFLRVPGQQGLQSSKADKATVRSFSEETGKEQLKNRLRVNLG